MPAPSNLPSIEGKGLCTHSGALSSIPNSHISQQSPLPHRKQIPMAPYQSLTCVFCRRWSRAQEMSREHTRGGPFPPAQTHTPGMGNQLFKQPALSPQLWGWHGQEHSAQLKCNSMHADSEAKPAQLSRALCGWRVLRVSPASPKVFCHAAGGGGGAPPNGPRNVAEAALVARGGASKHHPPQHCHAIRNQAPQGDISRAGSRVRGPVQCSGGDPGSNLPTATELAFVTWLQPLSLSLPRKVVGKVQRRGTNTTSSSLERRCAINTRAVDSPFLGGYYAEIGRPPARHSSVVIPASKGVGLDDPWVPCWSP